MRHSKNQDPATDGTIVGLPIKMTRDQRYAVKAAAAQSQMTANDFMLRAILAAVEQTSSEQKRRRA